MSINFKITFLHIIVGLVTAFFIFMIYDSYVVSQKKDLEKELLKVLKLNEDHMQRSLVNIQNLLKKERTLTKQIHLEAQTILQKDSTFSLYQIRDELKEAFNLKDKKLDIEFFLINKDYLIIDSTHKKNIGVSLTQVEKSKKSLDSLIKLGQYSHSEEVSVDFLDYEIKSFSYSKLNQNLFLGLGVIFIDSIDEKNSFDEMIEIANTNMDLLCVMKDSKSNQYYESLIAHRQKFDSNKEYLESKKKFPIHQKTEDFIINAARKWEVLHHKQDKTMNVYIPLVKEKNPMMTIPGDIVLKVELDISEQKLFFETIISKLIMFILLHFLLVFIIFYFTNKYQKIERRLNEENKKNEDLIEYNKQFISNLVHQIRTPLAIIMTNISLLEVIIRRNIKEYSFQINASINMLTNSYENLSYFVSYKSLNYQKKRVDLSSFVKDRISFFDDIAYANRKKIIVNIEDNCEYEINDIELERLIDNSISNALYFSEYEGVIIVRLNKIDEGYKLLIKVENLSRSKDIHLLSKKDIGYMKDMSSLGLGLHLIRKIVKKNSIDYSLSEENEKLFFEIILYDKYLTKVS